MSLGNTAVITDAGEAMGILRSQRNLLEGRIPQIRDADGREVPVHRGQIDRLTSPLGMSHVDLIGLLPITLTYDAGARVGAEQILTAGFYHPSIDYTTSRFEVYASDEIERLYDFENRIAGYDNAGRWKPAEPMCSAIQVFRLPEPVRARYFGVRILKANEADEIVRFAKFAVFSEEYTLQRSFTERYGPNLLRGDGPNAVLTDGIVFDPAHSLPVSPGRRFTVSFCLARSAALHRIVLFASAAEEPPDIRVRFTAGEGESGEISLSSDQAGPVRGVFVYDLWLPAPCEADALEFRIAASAPCSIQHMGAYTSERRIRVGQRVLNPNFEGVGVNVMPMALMAESRDSGYTRAHWEMEAKRIRVMKPRFVRLWFQPDWIQPEPGGFAPDSEKMRAVYPYLDLFQELDTTVQLNFGWKNGSAVQEWFSIPGADPRNSAPADLAGFAAACSETLRYLKRGRGYDCIRFLALYNEPDGRDFDSAGDDKAYYVAMTEAVHTRLEKDGLRDEIRFIGPEEGYSPEWVRYFYHHAAEFVDGFSFHTYQFLYDELIPYLEERKAHAAGKPLYMTELGWDAHKSNWDGGNAGYLIRAANAGVSACAYWMLDSVIPTDPLDFVLEGSMFFWGLLQKKDGPSNVYQTYYELAPFMRYIPRGSAVLESAPECGDLRCACFLTPSGDLTVAVEAKESPVPRTLRVFLPDSGGRIFRRHTVRKGVPRDADAALAPAEREIRCTGELTDEIGPDYQILFYTTLEPQPQILMEPAQAEVLAGAQLLLHASPVDFDGEIQFEIAAGPGRVTEDGLYSSAGAKPGDIAAVRAFSPVQPDAAGIALIRIGE